MVYQCCAQRTLRNKGWIQWDHEPPCVRMCPFFHLEVLEEASKKKDPVRDYDVFRVVPKRKRMTKPNAWDRVIGHARIWSDDSLPGKNMAAFVLQWREHVTGLGHMVLDHPAAMRVRITSSVHPGHLISAVLPDPGSEKRKTHVTKILKGCFDWPSQTLTGIVRSLCPSSKIAAVAISFSRERSGGFIFTGSSHTLTMSTIKVQCFETHPLKTIRNADAMQLRHNGGIQTASPGTR